VPNVRAKGQKLISVPMKLTFIEQMDGALNRLGCSTRSELIRKAVWEKMKRMGMAVPEAEALAPGRTGKGQVGMVRYAMENAPAAQWNERGKEFGKK